ncbi:hypothetical protein BCR35DRAFT_332199 [Leucosporidium creatinivorum]|uniref:F-box domain-containing protein n=1 Tax=Leucosporidium creatinivorum TaxID=106004 RepID=A0A1Y2F4S4_9BASI|nr:hypothetical protein BCR35DRAFT_332199 [Leucosporidium creatinivorum]
MAVIQDLPPETLYRIFELLEEAYAWYRILSTAKPNLCAVSLVAPTWTAWAQQLMLADIELEYRNDQKLLGHLQRRETRPLVQRLELRSLRPERVATFVLICQLVGGLETSRLESKAHEDDEVAVERLYPKVLVELNLKRPEIDGQLSGSRPSPLPHSLALEHLELSAEYFPSFSILRPLLLATHNLTSLTLSYLIGDQQRLGRDDRDAWLQVAPRLRHLHLCCPPEPRSLATITAGGDNLFLDAFLPACTSLVSFEIHLLSFENLFPRLALLTVQLRVLVTSFGVGPFNDRIPRRRIRRNFLHPPLSELKRWRMMMSVEAGREQEKEEFLEMWTELCEEFGVEARGEERYFTG